MWLPSHPKFSVLHCPLGVNVKTFCNMYNIGFDVYQICLNRINIAENLHETHFDEVVLVVGDSVPLLDSVHFKKGVIPFFDVSE